MEDFVSFQWFRNFTTEDASTGRQVVDSESSNLLSFIEEYGIIHSDNPSGGNEGDVITTKQLLNFQNNKERIFANYTSYERANVANSSDELLQMAPESIVLVPSVEIRIPVDKIRKEILGSQGNLVVKTNTFEAFWSEQIKDIITSPDYQPLNLEAYVQSSDSQYGINFKQKPEISVWIWCRKLGEDKDGKIINVTNFVQSINTNVDKNGGNFSIQLSPIDGDCDCSSTLNEESEKPAWFPKNLDFSRTQEKIFEHTDKVSINKQKRSSDYENVQNDFFFHNAIGTQDVVFIKFEPLKLDINNSGSLSGYDNDLFYIDKSDLKGQNFDMIGLVDLNRLSTKTTNGSIKVSIQVSGRDLSKLILDDGHYFYPLEFFAGNANGMFKEQTSDQIGNSVKRLVDGELASFTARLDRSVEFSLKFIFNYLYNITVVPQDLFSSIDDKTTFHNLDDTKTDEGTNNQSSEELALGIWQIFKLAISSDVSNRSLVDSSLITQSGSLVEYVKRICQEPFVEYFTDTYGDKFHMIVRKPPHDYETYKSLLETAIDVGSEDVYDDSLGFDDSEVYSWYRLTPQAVYMGSGQELALYDFPAIFLAQYADIWGARPMDVVTNYIDYKNFKQISSLEDKHLNYLKNQSVEDLRYMITSTAYLPFVRKGYLTIRADRRIKIGTCLRYKRTGEVFIVDAVSQQYSVNQGSVERVTVVQVSRGMVESHFDKYFKIVDTQSENIEKVPKKERRVIGGTYNVNFDYDLDFPIDPSVNSNDILIENGVLIRGGYPKRPVFVSEEIQRVGQQERERLSKLNDKYIAKMVKDMVDWPNNTFICEGHTDSDGSESFNLDLSRRRAQTIAEIVSRKVADEGIGTYQSNLSRITIVPKGESEPVSGVPGDFDVRLGSNQTVAQKKRNRRIVFFSSDEEEQIIGYENKRVLNWNVDEDIFNFLLKNKQFCDCPSDIGRGDTRSNLLENNSFNTTT